MVMEGIGVKKQLHKVLIVMFAALLSVSGVLFSAQGKAYAASNEPDIDASAAILVEADTGQILYEKNADAVLGIASMTKMMTEYLVLESIKAGRLKWTDEVPISKYSSVISQDRGLSNVPLLEGDQYTVKDLYEAMAIYSANGATIALAEKLGNGSEANFIKLMNDEGKKLGLESYKFVNATGLSNSLLKGMHPKGTKPTDENVMSARATAKLASHLIKDHPEALEISKIPKKVFGKGTHSQTEMANWNWMLPGLTFEYKGVDGLKTGHTDFAGYCFTGTAVKNGVRYITVIMSGKKDGKPEMNARFTQTAKLLDYGFDNFEMKEVIPANSTIKGHKTLAVAKGKEDSVAIKTSKPLKVLLKKGEEDKYQVKFDVDSKLVDKNGHLMAPFKKGQIVGKAALVAKDDTTADNLYGTDQKAVQVPVVTTKGVDKANWFALSMQSIGGFFSDVWTSASDNVKAWF